MVQAQVRHRYRGTTSECHKLPRRCLHKGEHLYRSGDPINALYRVRAGILKCYRVSEQGEEQVMGFYMAEDTCALDGFTDRKAGSNVVALDSTNLEVLPIALLFDPEAAQPMLIEQVVDEMSRELRRLARMLQLERCSAEQRLASFLLEHAAWEKRRGCSPSDFVLPMPRRDLARYLHLATETVSRVFSRLQCLGLLTVERNHVVLRDAARLRALSETPLDVVNVLPI